MRDFYKAYGLADLHCGFEAKLERGVRVKTPTHSAEDIATVMSFIEDTAEAGDVVILVGDQLDIGAISDHNNGKPRLVEGLRVTDDYDELNRLVLRPLDQAWAAGLTKVWITGNHENRVRRYLDANPGIEGLIEPEKYLALEKRGWLLQPEEVPYNTGKLGWTHTHSTFPRGQCKDPATKLVNSYHRSMVGAHLHGAASATHVTPADHSDYHMAWISPALCLINPGYNNNKSTNHNRGFMFGYIRNDGNFNIHPVLIAKGSFTEMGKTYGSRITTPAKLANVEPLMSFGSSVTYDRSYVENDVIAARAEALGYKVNIKRDNHIWDLTRSGIPCFNCDQLYSDEIFKQPCPAVLTGSEAPIGKPNTSYIQSALQVPAGLSYGTLFGRPVVPGQVLTSNGWTYPPAAEPVHPRDCKASCCETWDETLARRELYEPAENINPTKLETIPNPTESQIENAAVLLGARMAADYWNKFDQAYTKLGNERDLHAEALAAFKQENRCSVSMIQRDLKLGYQRAYRVYHALRKEGKLEQYGVKKDA